jgi:hypothetical protein
MKKSILMVSMIAGLMSTSAVAADEYIFVGDWADKSAQKEMNEHAKLEKIIGDLSRGNQNDGIKFIQQKYSDQRRVRIDIILDEKTEKGSFFSNKTITLDDCEMAARVINQLSDSKVSLVAKCTDWLNGNAKLTIEAFRLEKRKKDEEAVKNIAEQVKELSEALKNLSGQVKDQQIADDVKKDITEAEKSLDEAKKTLDTTAKSAK